MGAQSNLTASLAVKRCSQREPGTVGKAREGPSPERLLEFMTPDRWEELRLVRFLGLGLARITSSATTSVLVKRAAAVSLSKRLPVPRGHLTLPTGKKTTEGARGLLSHGLSQTFQQKPNQTIKPNAVGRGGPRPRPLCARAPQISMRLARRRQRGASTGTALRLISFPSRRSTCSLEKFMTSTTVQKLLMENSLILLPWR